MGESKTEPSGLLPGLREGRNGGGLFWELWLLFPALAMGQLCADSAPARVGAVLGLWQAQNLWKRSARAENVEFYFSQPIKRLENNFFFFCKPTLSPTPTNQTMFELHQTGGLKLVDLSQ